MISWNLVLADSAAISQVSNVTNPNPYNYSEPPRVLQVRVTVGVEYVVVLVDSTSKVITCTWMRPVMYSIYINRRGRRKRGYGKLQLNKVRRVGLPLILP